MSAGLLVVGIAPWVAAAQPVDASHFSYTGGLRVGESQVARAQLVPVQVPHTLDGGGLTLSLRHEDLRFEARADRAGLQYHVHAWTRAHAQGFMVHVAPGTLLDVAEGSRPNRVVFRNDRLGDVTLDRAEALPTWLTTHLADERLAVCDAATLYATPAEVGEPLHLEAGHALYTQPPRAGWHETWVLLGPHWVRGFTRGVPCEGVEGGLGLGSPGSSGFWEPPPHVLLPAGLRLVSPQHPHLVVARVDAPTDATSWGPGWTSANDLGALSIAYPCGAPDGVGRLLITAGELVPEGAPAEPVGVGR